MAANPVVSDTECTSELYANMTDGKADRSPPPVVVSKHTAASAHDNHATMSTQDEVNAGSDVDTSSHHGILSLRPAPYNLPTKHTTWTATTFAMAKCDCCEKQRRPMIQSCNTCSFSICRECYDAGKLAENRLHKMDEGSVAWTVVASQKAKAYRATRSSTIRGTRRGRARAARGAGRGSGRARGRPSTRARGRASRSCNSPSEASVPDTPLDSPLTDFTLPSDVSVDLGSSTPAREKDEVAFPESSLYHDPDTLALACDTDDEPSGEQAGVAANILTRLSRPSPLDTGTARQKQFGLRYNGVEMKQGNCFSPLPQTPVLSERIRSAEGNTDTNFFVTSQAKKSRTYGVFSPAGQSAGTFLSRHGSSESPMRAPTSSNITDRSSPVYSRTAAVGKITECQSPLGYASPSTINRKRPHSPPVPCRASRYRAALYPEVQTSTDSIDHTRVARPGFSLPPIASLLANERHAHCGHSLTTGAELVGSASPVHMNDMEERVRLSPQSLGSRTLKHNRRPRYTGPEQVRTEATSDGAPENPPSTRIDVSLLSQALQTGTRAMKYAHPGRSLDRCLRDQAAHAWDSGSVRQFLASGLGDDGDARDDAAAFELILGATYNACICLGLDGSNAAREWLCELEARLGDQEKEAAGGALPA